MVNPDSVCLTHEQMKCKIVLGKYVDQLFAAVYPACNGIITLKINKAKVSQQATFTKLLSLERAS